MRVGILGSGLMGGELRTLFGRAGHEVVFSYARSPRKLERLAQNARPKAPAGTPTEAVRDADALLPAEHWSRIGDVETRRRPIGQRHYQLLTSPMNADSTDLDVAHTSSGAEELAKMIPKARVVCAFNTAPSEVLFGVYEARRKARRPSLVYYGDDKRSKAVTAELIRDLGFDPVDAGPLTIARYAEPFALLVAQLAYEKEGAPSWRTVSSALRNRRYDSAPGLAGLLRDRWVVRGRLGRFAVRCVESHREQANRTS